MNSGVQFYLQQPPVLSYLIIHLAFPLFPEKQGTFKFVLNSFGKNHSWTYTQYESSGAHKVLEAISAAFYWVIFYFLKKMIIFFKRFCFQHNWKVLCCFLRSPAHSQNAPSGFLDSYFHDRGDKGVMLLHDPSVASGNSSLTDRKGPHPWWAKLPRSENPFRLHLRQPAHHEARNSPFISVFMAWPLTQASFKRIWRKY